MPFDALTGLKAFVVANALTDIGAPQGDHLAAGAAPAEAVGAVPPLRHDDARAEPDPHARRTASGRLTPVACDFKCGFDRDDPRWRGWACRRTCSPPTTRDFEQEVNQLRTHQGQTDVFVINEKGTILAPTFGGGANSLVTEVLGDAAIISSDFGGNPPYEKMKEVARICFRHWLKQSQRAVHHRRQVEQHRHLRDLPRHGRRAARAFLRRTGATPLYVVVGRGGPNLVRGMGALRDTCDALGLPVPLLRLRPRDQRGGRTTPRRSMPG